MVDFNDPHQGRSVYKQLINSLQGSLAWKLNTHTLLNNFIINS